MIHSRLRRSLRLAVDRLSLNFAGTGNGSRLRYLTFLGAPANASTIARPHSSALHLPRLLRFTSRPIRRSRRWSRLVGRRYLASSGLLLALSLEFCGCNLASGSDNAPDPHASAPMVRETLPIEPAMYFYDSAGSATEAAVDSVAPMLKPINLSFDSRPLPAEGNPVLWSIPESVYFVYKGRRSGLDPSGSQPREDPIATAFVFSIPNRIHGRFDRFLVTARHIVDPQWALCSEPNPPSIELRLNRRTGGVGYETIPLRSKAGQSFYTPTDSTADLAVIPLNEKLIADLDDYKFIDVPFSLLPTDAEMRLVHADQQVITARPSGEPGNYPSFDSGALAKMPSEPVGVRCGTEQNPKSATRTLHVWFIEAGVKQGFSGAPVYISIARGPGFEKTPVLLGIQSFAWTGKGMAGITPSSTLGSLIQSAIPGKKLYPAPDRVPTP